MAFQQRAATMSTITVAKEKFCKDQLVLSYKIQYPEFTSNCHRQNAKLVSAFYRQKAERLMCRIHQSLIKSAIKNYQDSLESGNPVLPYELVSTYQLTENCGHLISGYTDCYQFTGGAHGNTIRSSETWNISKGCRLSLTELCACGYSQLLRQIKAEIKRQIACQSENYFDNYEELVDQTFNTCQFYVEKGKVVIYFQQYDIAPYSTGIPTFQIPANICSICL